MEHALTALGFADVARVRVGRALTFEIEQQDSAAAERDARAMCERLLAHPVTADFTFVVRARA